MISEDPSEDGPSEKVSSPDTVNQATFLRPARRNWLEFSGIASTCHCYWWHCTLVLGSGWL